MSKSVHPLFATRGVPGTHDCKMLYNVLRALLKKILKELEYLNLTNQ